MNAVKASVNTNPSAFRREGYCVIKPGMGPARIEAVSEHLAASLGALKPGERPEGLVEPHMLAKDWKFWLELCRDPDLLDRVAACMGATELLLLMSHLIVKPPRDGMAVRWHQDNTYWPSVKGTDVVTVWLAIDDVDLENGCMSVIPCTHAGYPELEKLPTDGSDLLKVSVSVTPAMEAAAVPIELKRGAYSLHDSFVIHGSEANHSSRRRAGYTMRYADAATVQVDTAIHNKPVYYVRGNGANLRPDYIDFRPGKPLPASSGAEMRSEKHELLSMHKAASARKA